MKPDLKTLQKEMAEAILNPKERFRFLELLEPAGTLKTPEHAFEVYQNGYPARLTDALGETYETVWRIVGDGLFFSLCQDFISANKSRSFNLNDFDERFPDFLQQVLLIQDEFPFLAEVARLDWDFHTFFHSLGDEPKLWQASELERIGNQSRLILAAGLKASAFSFKGYDVWRAVRAGAEELPDSSSDEQWMAMFKLRGQEVQTMELTSWQYSVITALKRELPLERALTIGGESDEADEVSQLFGLILQNGWLVDVL